MLGIARKPAHARRSVSTRQGSRRGGHRTEGCSNAAHCERCACALMQGAVAMCQRLCHLRAGGKQLALHQAHKLHNKSNRCALQPCLQACHTSQSPIHAARTGELLDALVRGAVAAEADAVVRRDVEHSVVAQRAEAHRCAHVVCEDGERARKGHNARRVRRDACMDTSN